MIAAGSPTKRLWRCPKCGHRFVTRNIWHACGRYRLTDHFRGKPGRLRETFRRFVKAARAVGPVTVYAQKTRIVLQSRVRFANVVVRRDCLDAGLWLKRRVHHPLIHRVERFGGSGSGVRFRLHHPDDIDEALAKFLHEALVSANEPVNRQQRQTRRATSPANTKDRRKRQ